MSGMPIAENIGSLGHRRPMIKVRCEICKREMPGQPIEWPNFPFCSPRCRMIDLGRWLGEEYRVPASEQSPPDESSQEEDDAKS